MLSALGRSDLENSWQGDSSVYSLEDPIILLEILSRGFVLRLNLPDHRSVLTDSRVHPSKPDEWQSHIRRHALLLTVLFQKNLKDGDGDRDVLFQRCSVQYHLLILESSHMYDQSFRNSDNQTSFMKCLSMKVKRTSTTAMIQAFKDKKRMSMSVPPSQNHKLSKHHTMMSRDKVRLMISRRLVITFNNNSKKQIKAERHKDHNTKCKITKEESKTTSYDQRSISRLRSLS